MTISRSGLRQTCVAPHASCVTKQRLTFLSGVALCALCVPMAHAANAESYPTRPIRIVVPAAAGGITDILARIAGQKLGEGLGQQVIVDNRPGASGIVGSDIVAKSAPDGYTLLMVYPTHAVNPSLYAKMPYDTVKDFAPITMVSAVTLVLSVNASSPARNLQELIAMAKEKPGQLNYGSGGNGSLAHLGAELFRSLAGVNITHVAYKGAPQAATALISGEVAIFFDAPITVLPHLKAGKMRALGVSTKTRLAVLPDVPPIADVVSGYEVLGWNGLLAAAGTSPAIIGRLNAEIVKVLRAPSVIALLATHGVEPVGNTPQQFSAIIRADLEKWARVIKEAGIKAD
jgi:tripartite-type tricarboxylate transporter receptor subunit TctC